MTAPSRKKSEPPATALPEAAQALSPGIERGHHLALIASEGAGLSRLYAAAAVRDLAEGTTGGRVFVISATPDRALRCARRMAPTASEAGHGTMALTASSVPGVSEGAGAAILCSTPEFLLESIRLGHVAAGAVTTVILDDVASLSSAWPAVEAILQGADAGARRIATTHARDAAFDELLTRQLPRARRWPAELFDDAEPGKKKPAAVVRVAAAATPTTRIGRLTDLLHELAAASELGSASVHVAQSESLTNTKTSLAVEGFVIAEAEGGDGVYVCGPEVQGTGVEIAIAFGLPLDLTDFYAALGKAKRRFAIVDPLHLRQFEILASREGCTTKPLARAQAPDVPGDVEAFRDLVSAALERVDVGASTLLLAPLLAEYGATRVAATLAALLRESDRGVTATSGAPGDPSPEVERVTRPTWTRVFVDVGKRDGAQPGDLVGAITGETGAAGGQIGRIDVRQGFTLVDVDSLVADAVVRGLNGTRIKGRQVVARLDRDKGSP